MVDRSFPLGPGRRHGPGRRPKDARSGGLGAIEKHPAVDLAFYPKSTLLLARNYFHTVIPHRCIAALIHPAAYGQKN